jgi:hypothetical protein
VSLDDRALRQAFAALAEDAVPGSECPDPARILAVQSGSAPGPEARAVVNHLAGCPSCAEAWRLARELPAPVEAPAHVGWRWWGGWMRAGVAAAAVLVTLAGLWTGLPTSGPVYRERRAGEIRSLIAEDRPLPRAAFVLRWAGGPPGARYDVEVATEDLVLLHRARGLETSALRVPEAALAGLPSGARVLWRVEAHAPDGARIAGVTFVARVK